jgi:hypothetical protein
MMCFSEHYDTRLAARSTSSSFLLRHLSLWALLVHVQHHQHGRQLLLFRRPPGASQVPGLPSDPVPQAHLPLREGGAQHVLSVLQEDGPQPGTKEVSIVQRQLCPPSSPQQGAGEHHHGHGDHRPLRLRLR